MNSRHAHTVLLTLACSLSLAACSKEKAAAAESAAPVAQVAPAASAPVADPCALFSVAEVSESFADAKPGVRDHSTDKYDIATCTWDTPTNTFVVQLFKAKGSVEDELRSRVSGAVDPMRPGAGKHIRYEKFPGVGDDAMLVAEKGNADEGLFNDIVVLVVRRGDRMAVLFAHSLVGGDRPLTLAAIAAMGHQAAPRL